MENLNTQLGELFAAIQRSDVRQVRRLISANVSPNQRNADGKTALMVASSVGNSEIIRLLCAAAANHHDPARIFFDAGAFAQTIEESAVQPLGKVSPVDALKSPPPVAPLPYSTIIHQAQTIPTAPPNYLTAINTLGLEGLEALAMPAQDIPDSSEPVEIPPANALKITEPIQMTAAKMPELKAPDLRTPDLRTPELKTPYRQHFEPQPSEIQPFKDKAIAPQDISAPAPAVEDELNVEEIALEALLSGNIGQLPADLDVESKPFEPSISPETLYEMLDGETFNVVHPENAGLDDNSGHGQSADFNDEASRLLSEIEAIIRPRDSDDKHSPRQPVPIDGISPKTDEVPNNLSSADFESDFLEAVSSSESASSSENIQNEPISQDESVENNGPNLGANAGVDTESGKSPLEVAVWRNDLKSVRALLKLGADFRPANWYDTPVVVTAAGRGYINIVQTLVNQGANVNVGYDRLPLHFAAENGHMKTVQLLLNSGAYIHGQEESGRTALLAAAAAGHLPIVQLLLSKGANLGDAINGNTAIMLAAKNGHTAVYEFLQSLTSAQG